MLALDGVSGVTFNNNTTQASAGAVLQVVSTTLSSTFSMTGTTQTAITGLTATITPKFSTSKVLVTVSIGGFGQGTGQGRFILTRAGTNIGVGDTAGSRLSDTFTIGGIASGAVQTTGGITYMDSPGTTSSTTYGVTVSSNDAGQAIYINLSPTDSNSSSYQRNISTITLMEIAG